MANPVSPTKQALQNIVDNNPFLTAEDLKSPRAFSRAVAKLPYEVVSCLGKTATIYAPKALKQMTIGYAKYMTENPITLIKALGYAAGIDEIQEYIQAGVEFRSAYIQERALTNLYKNGPSEAVCIEELLQILRVAGWATIGNLKDGILDPVEEGSKTLESATCSTKTEPPVA